MKRTGMRPKAGPGATSAEAETEATLLWKRATQMVLRRRLRLKVIVAVCEEMHATCEPSELCAWMTNVSECVAKSKTHREEREHAVNMCRQREALLKLQVLERMRTRDCAHQDWTQHLSRLVADGQTCVVSFRVYLDSVRYLLLRLPCTLLQEGTARCQWTDSVTPLLTLPQIGTVRCPWWDTGSSTQYNTDMPLSLDHATEEFLPQYKTDVPLSLDPATEEFLPPWPVLGAFDAKRRRSVFTRESDLRDEEADRRYRRLRRHHEVVHQRVSALAAVVVCLANDRDLANIEPCDTEMEVMRTFRLKSLCETVATLPDKAAAEYARWQTVRAATLASTSLSSDAWSHQMHAVLEFWTTHLAMLLQQPGQLRFKRRRGASSAYDDCCYWEYERSLLLHCDAKIAIDHIEFGNTRWRNVRLCADAMHLFGRSSLFVMHRLPQNLRRPLPRTHFSYPEGYFIHGALHDPALALFASTELHAQIGGALLGRDHNDDDVFHHLLVAASGDSNEERHAISQNVWNQTTLDIQRHISIRDIITLVMGYSDMFVLSARLDTTVSSPMTHPYPVFTRSSTS